MKKYLIFSLFVLLNGCNQNSPEADGLAAKAEVEVDFIKPGKLVAMLTNQVTSYYVMKGQPRGFEYEMLKLFAKDHQLELEIKIVNDVEHLLDSISEGRADIAAGNITITGSRLKRVGFSPSLLETRQVLVQRLPDNYRKLSPSQIKARVLNDALQLDGKAVFVYRNSSYYPRLKNYASENGINIDLRTLPSETSLEEIFDMVSRAEIDYTVADENVARILVKYYKNLHIETPLSLTQRIGWAYNRNNISLGELLADWVENRKKTQEYRTIYNKYFKDTRFAYELASSLELIRKQEVSDLDELIRKYAEDINWDWRMLAALINKESKFNPYAESPYGARGLMQVMPTTAESFGINPEDLNNPQQNLRAGTRFIVWLYGRLHTILDDTTDIDKFVLASYNAGLGHVLDARRLAKKHNLDPDCWDDVSRMMLNKSNPEYYLDPVVKFGYCRGKETVVYVSKIMEYYDLYRVYAVL